MARPIGSYENLSARSKKRYEAYGRKIGKTPQQVHQDPVLRRAAEGHAATPRNPKEALRNPLKYQEYLRKNASKFRYLLNLDLADYWAAYKVGLQRINKFYQYAGTKYPATVFDLNTVFTNQIQSPPPSYSSRRPLADPREVVIYLSAFNMPDSMKIITSFDGSNYTVMIPINSDGRKRKNEDDDEEEEIPNEKFGIDNVTAFAFGGHMRSISNF